jgi:hypothetical protein
MATPNGIILYRGPSLLGGQPIVCIAVGLARDSKNGKTGAGVIQTFVLADNGESPLEALKSGADASICGNCPHRPQPGPDGTRKAGSCYVNVGQAPLAVYRAYRAERYPEFDPAEHLPLFAGRFVRLGAYGDPAAVPLDVWDAICGVARGWTGYTHQFRVCDRGYARYCMASCETVEDRRLALSLGYRTFRVRLPEQPLDEGEFVCPASAEGGFRRTCEDCRACAGARAGVRNASPAIVVHGLAWKAAKYRATLAQLRPDRNGRINLL